MRSTNLIPFLSGLMLICLMLSFGCQISTHSLQGQIVFQFKSTESFSTREIKAQTRAIHAVIYDSHLSLQNALITPAILPNSPSISLDVPVGKKTIIVAAYNSQGLILTAGKTEQIIVTGNNRAEIELFENYSNLLNQSEILYLQGIKIDLAKAIQANIPEVKPSQIPVNQSLDFSSPQLSLPSSPLTLPSSAIINPEQPTPLPPQQTLPITTPSSNPSPSNPLTQIPSQLPTQTAPEPIISATPLKLEPPPQTQNASVNGLALTILSPKNLGKFKLGTTTLLEVDLQNPDNHILKSLEILANQDLIYQSSFQENTTTLSAIISNDWNPNQTGIFDIQAVVKDELGKTLAQSNTVRIEVIP